MVQFNILPTSFQILIDCSEIFLIFNIYFEMFVKNVQALESVLYMTKFSFFVVEVLLYLFHWRVIFCLLQGIINFTSTYDSRTQEVEGSLVARGDLWRLEASHGGSTSGNENSSLFLVQLGPLLFIRDSTLLLPVHLSKQHLLWYGYDRKVKITFFWLIRLCYKIGNVWGRGIKHVHRHCVLSLKATMWAFVLDFR